MDRGSRFPWDGGLNLSGFSSTMGFEGSLASCRGGGVVAAAVSSGMEVSVFWRPGSAVVAGWGAGVFGSTEGLDVGVFGVAAAPAVVVFDVGAEVEAEAEAFRVDAECFAALVAADLDELALLGGVAVREDVEAARRLAADADILEA